MVFSFGLIIVQWNVFKWLDFFLPKFKFNIGALGAFIFEGGFGMILEFYDEIL